MTDPLPRRIAWFAPWTWERRTLWTTVGMLGFVAYPISVGPAHYLFVRGWVPDVSMAIYLPIWWLADHSATVNDFVTWYVNLYLRNF